MSIDQSGSSLVVGGTLQLSVTVTATGGASEAVTWSSSNPSVASVSAGGLVTAHAPGSAAITATSNFDDSKSDGITITVTPAPAAAIVPASSDCGTAGVGDTCQVSVGLQNNALTWQGTEFDITNPNFTLQGVTTGSLTAAAGCLASAGPERVGIICAGTFTGDGQLAVVTFARTVSSASSFTTSGASLIDTDANVTPVAGGVLGVP